MAVRRYSMGTWLSHGSQTSKWKGPAWDQLPGGRVARVVPGEVDPFRVPELVAHEVEVRLPAQRHRYQPDHLLPSPSHMRHVTKHVHH